MARIVLKKRLWHKCFPVNFVKFLRTPFYRIPLNDCSCMWIIGKKEVGILKETCAPVSRSTVLGVSLIIHLTAHFSPTKLVNKACSLTYNKVLETTALTILSA